jgi:glucose-1-phosphate cytidylyltransferase
MKALILAGGFGTRISEETNLKPKPMIEIGGKPILWHIMKMYSAHGINEFVLLLGYKGYVIKEFFANYFLHESDVTIDIANNKMEILNNTSEPWKVTLLDTGANTMTGGRIKRAANFVGNEPFLVTYGDGVADVDITATINFHKQHGKAITMTAVQPAGRFGALEINNDATVHSFVEKPNGDGNWINGGFFVCNPSVFDAIKNDATVFEKEPLESLANANELVAYKHQGFWQCMDTLRDKILLNDLWDSNTAPWKKW